MTRRNAAAETRNIVRPKLHQPIANTPAYSDVDETEPITDKHNMATAPSLYGT